MTFHVILGRPPVSKMKWLEKCHWRCSFIFLVSPVFIAALDVSVMGEMILQWVPYFCQNNVKHKFSIQCTYRRRQWGNVKHKFSSQCTYRRRQWGLKICQRYVKISKILLCQVNFTKYDYDKCQRKNRSGSFPWTVVAPQSYPKKELLQMFWVFSRNTVVKVWFFKKVTTQWTGSLEKANLLFRLLREFSEIREKGELQSHIIGRTLGTSIYVRKVISVFSSLNFIISRIFKIIFCFIMGHKLCSRESTSRAW